MLSCRMILAIMGFFGTTSVYLSRINLSIAIVEMLGVKSSSSSKQTDYCQDLNSGNSSMMTDSEEVGEFGWSQQQRGLILGCYYYGYVLLQIPSAWLCNRYGFRAVFGWSMLMASILTLLFPISARSSFYLAVAARVALGVFHAVTFPALAGAWGSWAPPNERSRLNGISVAGASAGTCIIFAAGGVIITKLGWPAIFYITGGLNLVWVVAWFYLVHNSPDHHPRIHADEKVHINESIGEHKTRLKSDIPWKSILTSAPVWGFILGHTASNWGNYTLNQQLPTYLTNVLGVDLELTGLLSCLCYGLQWIVCIVASYLTDFITSRKLMTTLRIRKLNTIIGLWVTGICVGLAGELECKMVGVITLFFLSAGLNTFTVPGCKSSMLDIAPAFSGIVFGISNTMSNIPGFLAPQIVGSILVRSVVSEWKVVFWLSCGVHIIGSLLYLIKGRDDIQEWAKHSENKSDEIKMKNNKNETQQS